MTISVIAVVIFVLLFFFKDHATAIGFFIGAVCSLAAGYIGMRIAVLANTRTAQAATQSREQPPCEWLSTAARSRACSSWAWRCWRSESFTSWAT